MWSQQRFLLQVMILFLFGKLSNAAKYRLVIEDDMVFTDCPNQPSSVFSVREAWDLSNLIVKLEGESAIISGNATMHWKIQVDDRVEAKFEIFRFDRGTWLPTIINIVVKDFCKLMYDDSQYWYKTWTRHITNVEDVKSICLNVPGTTLVHHPFEVDVAFDVVGANVRGRHKVVANFKAFDKQNMARETSFCFEFIGDVVRAN